MISLIRKHRTYRTKISQPGIRPISFPEWWVGRYGMSLLNAATRLAIRRGDHASVSAALLGVWASDQSGTGLPLHRMDPRELSVAIQEERLHLTIEPPEDHHG